MALADGENENDPGHNWKFSQWFRKLPSDEENLAIARNYELTALEFDKSGQFLASGDRSGTVVVLKNDPAKATQKGDPTHYGLFTEIISYQPEFDYLISKPIEPGITALKWGPQTNSSQYLLTSNTKQIRLWRLQDRETLSFANFNMAKKEEEVIHQGPGGKSFKLPKLSLNGSKEPDPPKSAADLKVPKIIREQRDVVCDLKRDFFKGSHKVFITQLSVANDTETFMSCDSLSINQWSLHRENTCHGIVDLVNGNEQLTEIILSLDHHPEHDNLFLYGTSKGKLNLCDLRIKALAVQPCKMFDGLKKPNQVIQADTLEEQVMVDEASMFDEVTSGITGMQFSGGGRFIITRDYMSVKIWDINYEKKPIETYYVQEFLRPRLFELHEHNRTWQDNFKVSVSPQGNIATGTYSNYFHVFDLGLKKDTFIQASMAPEAEAHLSRMNRRKKVSYLHPQEEEYLESPKEKKSWLNLSIMGNRNKKKEQGERAENEGYPFHLPFQNIDFNKKAAQICWHPEEDVIAVAGENNLYMYSK